MIIMGVEDKEFQEYYKQVTERDRIIAENTPIPSAQGSNVWIVFGLSIGIATIVFSFFSKYSVVMGIIALVLSFVGYTKKKDNTAIAGLVCSLIGIILGAAFTLYRYFLFSAWQDYVDGILQKITTLVDKVG